jgi:lipopolysaccharide/colanic/teichoic acid biosynthesis glycosyltransferase
MYERSKRLLDISLSLPAMVVLSPLMLIIAALVRVTSPGPALHRAVRCGRDGELFTLLKFRSMRAGSADHGPAITAGGDARVTRLGRLLRKSKLDELPQLLNVLHGDMSLVGPRPEDPRYVESYDATQRTILRWRPGMTSPASITYRDEEAKLATATDVDQAYSEIMDAKIAIDLAYFSEATLRGDLEWIGRTLVALAKRGDD